MISSEPRYMLDAGSAVDSSAVSSYSGCSLYRYRAYTHKIRSVFGKRRQAPKARSPKQQIFAQVTYVGYESGFGTR